jgi:uncharacterized protein YjeT (DUF2065 family)
VTASVVIARIIGPALLVLGLVMLVRPALFRRLGRQFVESEALLFLSGLLTLVAGLAIVATHNRWVPGWPLAVTLLGWLMVLAGTLRMAIPDRLRPLGRAMLEPPARLRLPGAALALLGAYLARHGYL